MKTAIVNLKDIQTRDPSMRMDAAFHIAYEENKKLITSIEGSPMIMQGLDLLLIAQPMSLKKAIEKILPGQATVNQKNVDVMIKRHPALCAALMFKEADKNIKWCDAIANDIAMQKKEIVSFKDFIKYEMIEGD